MMNSWTIVAILTPYILGVIWIIFYFLRKKDDTLINDHDLLIKIKKSVENIEAQQMSAKAHFEYFDKENDVHESWLSNLSQAFRQIKIFHYNNHNKENIDIDDLIKRPVIN